MKHEKFFKDFLSDHVNLNQSRLDSLENKLSSIIKFLKSNISNYGTCNPQGSYAHKTIIKPVQENDEFDVDILLVIKDSGFNPKEFKKDYVDVLYNTFKESDIYKDKIKRNTRCITVNYADDFHLDIVPCIKHGDSSYICNRKDEKYEETDGDNYKQWLIKNNKIVGDNNFRKTNRLLKFLRDHKNTFSVKSILLTTLLGSRVKESDKDSNEFSDLPTTLKTLSNRVNQFLQSNESMPIIENPELNSENFNRHWDKVKYENFRDKFKSYTEKINEAFKELEYNKSIKKWQELFGDKFGKLTNNCSNSSKPVKIIPSVLAIKPYGCCD